MAKSSSGILKYLGEFCIMNLRMSTYAIHNQDHQDQTLEIFINTRETESHIFSTPPSQSLRNGRLARPRQRRDKSPQLGPGAALVAPGSNGSLHLQHCNWEGSKNRFPRADASDDIVHEMDKKKI